MATDLSAILSGTATPDPAPAPDTTEPTPGPGQDAERFDDELDDGWEDGREKPDQGDKQPGEPGPETPPVSDEEEAQGRVPVAAIKEERRKRQEAERKALEYERELAALRSGQQPEDQQVDPVRQRLDLSVEYARDQFPDYEEKEAVFIEAIKRHPRGDEIYQEMLRKSHPAKFAYELGEQLLALREIGPDPRAFLRQARASAPEPKSAPPSIPQPLAASRDSGGRFAPANSAAPTPLSEIIAR